jgi:hypothetical protein
MSDPKREEQTIGSAADEPPGRRRDEEKDGQDEGLYEEVPGQSQQPAGDGA